MTQERFILNQDDFVHHFANGWIVDARDGGLIVGRSHFEGHILMFEPTQHLGEYVFCGLVSGGEYILSREATERHRDRIEEINSYKSECFEQVRLSEQSRIINTRAEPHDKFMIIDRQFIVNANATRAHFAELEAMNGRYRHHHGRVLDDGVIKYLEENS